MQNSSRHLLLMLAVAALLTAGGCVRHPYHAAPPLNRPDVRREYVGALQQRYPPQFRLKQRLALRALGKQYDMIGYLVVEPGGDFRAMALGEMGGRIFDLALEKGQPRALKKPDKMPPRPLLDGVIGDIRHMFASPECVSPEVRMDKERGPYLSLRSGKSMIQDYVFREAGGGCRQISRSLESDGRRILREAEFSDYRKFPDVDRPIPTRIMIKNYRWHYTMEIQTLEILPGKSGTP